MSRIKKGVGLSKLARTVDVFAKRPQLQQRLTSQIADSLHTRLNARAVLMLIESEHLCLRHRGDWQTDAQPRREVLDLMQNR